MATDEVNSYWGWPQDRCTGANLRTGDQDGLGFGVQADLGV